MTASSPRALPVVREIKTLRQNQEACLCLANYMSSSDEIHYPSIPHPDPSIPHPDPSIPHPDPSIPHPDPSIPHPDPSIPHPDPSIPHPDPSIPHPDPSIPHPDPSIPQAQSPRRPFQRGIQFAFTRDRAGHMYPLRGTKNQVTRGFSYNEGRGYVRLFFTLRQGVIIEDLDECVIIYSARSEGKLCDRGEEKEEFLAPSRICRKEFRINSRKDTAGDKGCNLESDHCTVCVVFHARKEP
ncbi:protein SCARECROW 1-like [Penaeus japonicus]|uniref:protein SCARECROW 1-like n=1 Tax=Penaeus japonicus TaxID=27405 RepID=UPI001C716210|nr:protein SCARECROW 1-like [Penaeus japonicus]